MIRLRSLLPTLLALSFVPSLALADDASPVEQARRRIDTALVKPLAQQESAGSRFSRARPMPHDRRVRVTSAILTQDKSGKAFLPYSIDVRYGGDWTKDDIVGCVYPSSGDVYVKRGDTVYPAGLLLGKKVRVVEGACTTGAAPAAPAA